jgi:hypothetical protein
MSSLNDLVHEYHVQGFGIIRGLFSPDEIAVLDEEAHRLLERTDLIDTNNLRCRWQNDVTSGACLFDAFDPVVDIGPACARIASDSRIQELLQAVYGEPAWLFRDKLIFKPPGACGYGLHQDYIAWPSFPRSFLTILVPIDCSDSLSGCTEVFAGCHEQGYLMEEDGDYHEIPPGYVDESQSVKLILSPGDVAFFGGFTPHRSAPNRSRHWRRQLYLSYNADSDGGDCRTSHYGEFHEWLRKQYAKYGRNNVHYK